MYPTEPSQEGPAASDDLTISWEWRWRPTTVPIPEEPAPTANFLSPAGSRPYPPVFAPVPTEPRSKRRKGSGGWVVLALVLGIALGGAGASAAQYWLGLNLATINSQTDVSAAPGATPSPAWSRTPPASPQPTQTATPVLTPTPIGPAWTMVQSFSGTGTTNTPPITVPKSWRIVWQCNPTSSLAGQYRLAMVLFMTNGTVVGTTLDTTCKDSNTAGVDQQYQAGTFYLQILTTADWAMQIQVHP